MQISSFLIVSTSFDMYTIEEKLPRRIRRLGSNVLSFELFLSYPKVCFSLYQSRILLLSSNNYWISWRSNITTDPIKKIKTKARVLIIAPGFAVTFSVIDPSSLAQTINPFGVHLP